MVYQEDLREGQVVAIWAGNLPSEDVVIEYLGQPFEQKFGFLLDPKDLPEYVQASRGKNPTIKLLKSLPDSKEWFEVAAKLCRQSGFESVKTVVAFYNLRYRPKRIPSVLKKGKKRSGPTKSFDGGLQFIGNVSWPGGKGLWEELQESRLAMPPFPRLVRDDVEDGEIASWKGIVHLGSWRGFATREQLADEFSWFRFSARPDGEFSVQIEPPPRKAGKLPSPAQAKAFKYLLEHQPAIRDAVLKSILKVYPKLRKIYYGSKCSNDGGKTWQRGWDLPEMFPPENMPDIKDSKELRRLIRLGSIHVLPRESNGYAYIGFEFNCKWDQEHGLGVLTHKGKVLDVGAADAAF